MANTPKRAGARPRKKGDESTNARKRYYRAAERNLKKAEKSSGVTASRYRELARQNFIDALNTYESTNKQRVSQPIQRLANEFNISIDEYQRTRQKRAASENVAIRERERTKQRLSIFRSETVLESRLQDAKFRSEIEAREIFSSHIGSRIIGGLVDVWQDSAVDETGRIDKGQILEAIKDYFGVDSLVELLEKIESKIGEDLYKDPGNESLYESIKLTIQTKLIDNSLVN